jgi:hypothetical protein
MVFMVLMSGRAQERRKMQVWEISQAEAVQEMKITKLQLLAQSTVWVYSNCMREECAVAEIK